MRIRIAYRIAELYQNCWFLAGRFDLVLDFLWGLEKIISPMKAPEGYIDGIMADVIRRRAGISEEDWNSRLEKLRRNEEREELGLPKEE